MNGEDFKSNSHKSKENARVKEKAEKVISGTATRKKKSEVSKLASSVMAEDAKNVWQYVTQDVLIPSLKKAISDIVTNGIDMLLYGETGVSKRTTSSGQTRIPYRNYYDRNNSTSTGATRVSHSSYDFDDVIVDNRAEAERILRSMDAQIADFGSVTVADMYDLAGLNSNWTDNKYGWTNINAAEAVRVRDGRYVLKMPKAVPL